MRPVRAATVLWICAAVLGGALAGILALGDLRQEAAAFLALYGVAFAAFSGALAAIQRAAPTAKAVAGVLAGGVVFRALLLPAAPSLSDDIYRYVWDGRVQAAGLNPYAHPPSSSALASLRDSDVHPRINHPGVRTIYPPAAQILFAGARGPFDSPTGMKLLLVLLDIATSIVLWRLLARRGRPLWVVVHAWNPLCIVEIAHSGHMDALPLFLLVVALERLDAGRLAMAAMAIGLSAAAKFFALALLPFFGRRWKPAWLVVPAVVAALYLPYLGAGWNLASGLGTFAASWRFNDGAFALIEKSLRASLGRESWNLPGIEGLPPAREHARAVVARAGGEPFHLDRALESIERDPGTVLRNLRAGDSRVPTGYLSHVLAQGIGLVLLGLLVVLLWLRGVAAETAALAVLAAGLALSPTVQPWYVTWLVPLAALCRSHAAIAWSGTVALAYAVFLRAPGESWEVPVGWRVLEYAVPLAVLAFEVWRARLTPRSSAPYPAST
jgi:hypothetical protein